MASRNGDDIEQIAMVAGCGISPFTGRPSIGRGDQTDIEAASGRIAGIAHQPVPAFTMSFRQIAATDTLGIIGEALRYPGGGVLHLTSLRHRSEERRVGKECVSTLRSRWSPFH